MYCTIKIIDVTPKNAKIQICSNNKNVNIECDVEFLPSLMGKIMVAFDDQDLRKIELVWSKIPGSDTRKFLIIAVNATRIDVGHTAQDAVNAAMSLLKVSK